MGIKVAYITEHGIELPAAYINVNNISLNKSVVQVGNAAPRNQLTIQFDADVFADQAAFAAGRAVVQRIPMAAVYDTDRPAITNAYEHLKAQPQFAGAEDC